MREAVKVDVTLGRVSRAEEKVMEHGFRWAVATWAGRGIRTTNPPEVSLELDMLGDQTVEEGTPNPRQALDEVEEVLGICIYISGNMFATRFGRFPVLVGLVAVNLDHRISIIFWVAHRRLS
jgi:hypothetical protein